MYERCLAPRAALALVVAGALLVGHDASSAEKRQLTVIDTIESTRFLADTGPLVPMSVADHGIFISPDQGVFAVLLVRGDMERNGLWLEVRSGSLASFEAASGTYEAGRVFMSGLGAKYGNGNTLLAYSGFNPIKWIDNERIAFLWEDANGIAQVHAANVRTRTLQLLTRHLTDVVSFDVGSSGDVAYAARAQPAPDRSSQLIEKGFVVTNLDAISLVNGDVDGSDIYSRAYESERFVLRHDAAVAQSIAGRRARPDPFPTNLTLFSPDGRLILFDAAPLDVPEEWRAYTERMMRRRVGEYRDVSRRTHQARAIQKLFLATTATGDARPLWNAPRYAVLHAAWSPDSRSILLGPTFLPVSSADAGGLAATAVAVVDSRTGDFVGLPMPPGLTKRGVHGVRWLSTRAVEVDIEIDSSGSTLQFGKRGKRWDLARQFPTVEKQRREPVHLEWRQDINTPPALFAVETATGRERMVLDPNPALRSKNLLARVEHVNWKDSEERSWSGRLYQPVLHDPARRSPLVIQTHGHARPGEFSLYGYKHPTLGPGTSVYAAQVLANRGIAVLQVEDKSLPGIDSTDAEAETYMKTYEAAIRYLEGRGLVDRAKVGLVGYSRTGWHVEHALAHSGFPYAAALVSDNWDAGYVQASLLGWPSDYSLVNGAPPFGEGLSAWQRRAPGINACKIQTPLRMQREGFGLAGMLMAWEMYSRLRHLNKPVELVAIPRIDRGSHGIQNPAQVLASQQGAVDWFAFWLNGYADPDPRKTEQYARWNKMREQHRASERQGALPGQAGDPALCAKVVEDLAEKSGPLPRR